MKTLCFTISAVAGAALLCFTEPSSWASDASVQDTHAAAPTIDGDYELVKRVMSDGKEILPPAIGALWTMSKGRGNFNLFVKEKDGTLASEATISRYTLTEDEYCVWIVFMVRNNLDRRGVSNDVPAVTDHCGPVTLKDGRLVFQPAGEGVVLGFDENGFTATVAGQFVDHWTKLR